MVNFDDFVKQNGSSTSLEKGEHIFHQGDVNDSLYFVVSGLLKAYYLSAEGKENIKSFIKAGSTIGSLSSAYKGLPCTFNLLVLENAQLIRFSFDQLKQASEQNQSIANTFIETLLMLSMKKEQREYEFLMLTAEQRYLNFREQEPELFEKLTQNDIAKYLGITPVALSRIKTRTSLNTVTKVPYNIPTKNLSFSFQESK